MLIDKIKKYADSLVKNGKSIEEVKTLVDEFIGDEEITDKDDNVVTFSLKVPEKVENVDIELDIKEVVKEEIKAITSEVKVTPAVISKEFKVPARAKKFGALKSFEGPDAYEEAYLYGMWVYGTLGVKSAQDFCANKGIDIMGVKTTQIEGTSTLGGHLTPDILHNILIHNVEKHGIMRSLCQIFPMTSDVHLIPKVNQDVSAEWITEASSITEQNKTFTRVTLTAGKIATLSRISSELNEDSIIPMMDMLVKNIANKIAKLEDRTILLGTSGAEFNNVTGIVTLLDTDSGSGGESTFTASTEVWASITLADIHSLMAILPEYADNSNTVFICSKNFKNLVLDRLAGAAGGNTIQSISGGFTPSFFGVPIKTSPLMSQIDNPSSTPSPTTVLIYGDISAGVAFGDRSQIEVTQLRELYAGTDEIGLIVKERIAIAIHEPASVSVAGPIVGLLA